MTRFVDAYAVLGVPATASPATLKAAHRRGVRRHHPDLAPPEDRAEATRRTTELNVAYGLVRDPAARAAYDEVRDRQRRRGGTRDGGRPDAVLADAQLGEAWDRLLVAAGRWAGRFWALRRRQLARAGAVARQAGRDLGGRLVWLAWCVVGTTVGLGAAVAAQRGLGLDSGGLGVLAGLLAGAWAGSARGWRARMTIAGADPALARWLPQAALAVVAVAAGVAADAQLAQLTGS